MVPGRTHCLQMESVPGTVKIFLKGLMTEVYGHIRSKKKSSRRKTSGSKGSCFRCARIQAFLNQNYVRLQATNPLTVFFRKERLSFVVKERLSFVVKEPYPPVILSEAKNLPAKGLSVSPRTISSSPTKSSAN